MEILKSEIPEVETLSKNHEFLMLNQWNPEVEIVNS